MQARNSLGAPRPATSPGNRSKRRKKAATNVLGIRNKDVVILLAISAAVAVAVILATAYLGVD